MEVFEAIGQPTRREILRLLAGVELSAGAVAARFDLTQPAISQHLKILREAGLVEERREGTRRLYRVRPEGVFEHFTDPLKLVRWMGSEATLDPRPGGVFRLVFLAGAVVIGEFVEVAPYHRVVFTWGWEQDALAVPPASTEVEVDLTP